jgi:putative ABC transport system ATP-binding protein
MFSMHNISKVYRTDLIETHALRDFSLEVTEGRVRRRDRSFRLGQDHVPEHRGLLESFDTGSLQARRR